MSSLAHLCTLLFRTYILDVLFPLRCIGCGSYDTLTCKNCISHIKLHETEYVPSPLQQVYYLGSYQDPFWNKLIEFLKFRGVRDIANPLIQSLAPQLLLQAKVTSQNRALLVPVPLHRARLRERGYNQSEMIAQALANSTHLQVLTQSIMRKRKTRPQTSLSRLKRLTNIQGAFALQSTLLEENQRAFKGKHIFLIDDVFTTGATLHELASLIAPFHPRSLSAFVLAKG